MKQILLVLIVSATGCTNPWGRVFTDAAAGSGAGFITSTVTRGNPAYTALGTVGGIAAAEGIRALKLRQDRKTSESIDQARLGQETKADYFSRQAGQRPVSSPTQQIPVPLPERVTQDGVRLEPSTEWIEIHQ